MQAYEHYHFILQTAVQKKLIIYRNILKTICTSKLIYINVLRVSKHVNIYFDINLIQSEFINNVSITSALHLIVYHNQFVFVELICLNMFVQLYNDTAGECTKPILQFI